MISGRDETRNNQPLSVHECTYTMRVGMVLVVRPYVHHICDRLCEKGAYGAITKLEI